MGDASNLSTARCLGRIRTCEYSWRNIDKMAIYCFQPLSHETIFYHLLPANGFSEAIFALPLSYRLIYIIRNSYARNSYARKTYYLLPFPQTVRRVGFEPTHKIIHQREK
jgi:hypothetical protein